MWIILIGTMLIPHQQAKSDYIFLKCIGKFEINRGKLINPDWDMTYITINSDELEFSIEENGIKDSGRYVIKGNSYTFTHKDDRNRIKAKYKINRDYGNYLVNYPRMNKTLIGTCQKGRG